MCQVHAGRREEAHLLLRLDDALRRQAVHPVLPQRRQQHIRSRSVTIGISGMCAPSAGRASSATCASWRERAELPLPASRRLNLHAIVRRRRSYSLTPERYAMFTNIPHAFQPASFARPERSSFVGTAAALSPAASPSRSPAPSPEHCLRPCLGELTRRRKHELTPPSSSSDTRVPQRVAYRHRRPAACVIPRSLASWFCSNWLAHGLRLSGGNVSTPFPGDLFGCVFVF
ncbi:hypothetical protein DFH09DRAFT_1397925 [Mycena vulgaris]|nr:hypothetical protein DFH09DRAFT_1397925 [Mycena vulgaris]